MDGKHPAQMDKAVYLLIMQMAAWQNLTFVAGLRYKN